MGDTGMATVTLFIYFFFFFYLIIIIIKKKEFKMKITNGLDILRILKTLL